MTHFFKLSTLTRSAVITATLFASPFAFAKGGKGKEDMGHNPIAVAQQQFPAPALLPSQITAMSDMKTLILKDRGIVSIELEDLFNKAFVGKPYKLTKDKYKHFNNKMSPRAKVLFALLQLAFDGDSWGEDKWIYSLTNQNYDKQDAIELGFSVGDNIKQEIAQTQGIKVADVKEEDFLAKLAEYAKSPYNLRSQQLYADTLFYGKLTILQDRSKSMAKLVEVAQEGNTAAQARVVEARALGMQGLPDSRTLEELCEQGYATARSKQVWNLANAGENSAIAQMAVSGVKEAIDHILDTVQHKDNKAYTVNAHQPLNRLAAQLFIYNILGVMSVDEILNAQLYKGTYEFNKADQPTGTFKEFFSEELEYYLG